MKFSAFLVFLCFLFPLQLIAQETDSTLKKSGFQKLVDRMLDDDGDDSGFGPIGSYSSRDHIHIGVKYTIDRRSSMGARIPQKHEFAVRYSISEEAFSYGYEGIFEHLIGNWDLELNGGYDHIRWINFAGIGNETVLRSDNRDYHRVRTRDIEGYLGLRRSTTNNIFRIGGIFQSVRVLNDPGRFHTEFTPELLDFSSDQFLGVDIENIYRKLNDRLLPSRGLSLQTNLRFLKNIDADSSLLSYGAEMNGFLPLGKLFVFSLKTGAASLSGKPEFFQLHRLGGARNLRGYRRWRFHGETMFYNQAELQWIRNARLGKITGRAGLIAMYDIGRVWQPGEESDTWHSAYGAGVLLAPFNKFSVAVFYAISREENDISLRLSTGF
jgi:hypothetical protein